jgi:hypothetical protein
MNYAERVIGDFRIHAGTKMSPLGGFLPGVAVVRIRGPESVPERIYYNDDLCKGVRFETSVDAVQHALDVGVQMVRLQLALDS